MVPLSIDVFKKIADERGGKCLSAKYLNNKQKLDFECSEGHRWSATGAAVKSMGHWCKKCAGLERLSLEVFQKLAEERGGRCLSSEYLNKDAKLEFECSEGHRWFATGGAVRNQDQWCPHCAGVARLTIQAFHELAESRGGRCLSSDYVNKKEKLEFECSEGHIWKTTGDSIRSGRWCPTCAGTEQLTIDVFRELAESRGGKCLSTEYLNNRAKLEFECSEGHRWATSGGNVRNGDRWCPTCAGVITLSIDDFRKVAEERGGKCHSTSYVNIFQKLEFECSEGHRWFAAGGAVKNAKQWCPHCKTARGEKNALAFASSASWISFEKARPDWLRVSKLGSPMELDGYSDSAGLAIEYQGEQHYEYCPDFFHRDGYDVFLRQLERDRIKAERVAARGILLLAVPSSRFPDEDSVREAVVSAAEEACFPLFGVNREFTEMVKARSRRFSDCVASAVGRFADRPSI